MLTNKQLKEIELLQRECEADEPIQLKMNWDLLESRSNDEVNDFFYYEQGHLAGFLGIYGFGHTAELCGMVAPANRRKGIFSKLFSHAAEIMRERHFTTILLNAPAKSATANGFLQTIDCTYSFSEHQMQWKETELEEPNEVTLRCATDEDIEREIQIDVQCFQFDEDDAREYNICLKRKLYDRFYMIEANEKTVGKIRVSHLYGKAWIYGFAILPEYQGNGYGRKALNKVIIDERRSGYPIFLEVEVKNANALKVYQACGFEAYHSQDYYEFLNLPRLKSQDSNSQMGFKTLIM